MSTRKKPGVIVLVVIDHNYSKIDNVGECLSENCKTTDIIIIGLYIIFIIIWWWAITTAKLHEYPAFMVEINNCITTLILISNETRLYVSNSNTNWKEVETTISVSTKQHNISTSMSADESSTNSFDPPFGAYIWGILNTWLRDVCGNIRKKYGITTQIQLC